MVTSKLGDHSFLSLSKNTVDRVRKLAGTFIEGAQSRLGITTKVESAFAQLNKGGPLHLHRFLERTPTCDEEGIWKSETFGWKVAMESEQERLQDGTSTNR